MSSVKNFGLATPEQVEAVKAQWARLYGETTKDGPRELDQYTGRTDPARLTKVEARLYLDLLKPRPTPAKRPRLTEEQLAEKVRRL